MYNEISRCRICGNPELDPIINLGLQAFTGIFPRSRDQEVPRGPLDLVKCRQHTETCGLVQLRHSSDPSLMFGLNYGYRSGLNQSMIQHLAEVARQITERVHLLPGDLILDIGSNDGTLLRALNTPGVTLLGMDPTAAKFRQYYPPEAEVICDLFSAARFRREYGSRKAKVITSIAMFYDLESPLATMQEIADILADDGIWVLEQSYLPTMVENNSYDTICHEHLEYYALAQLEFMAKRVGLTIMDVLLNDTNGGSFLVIVSRRDNHQRRHNRVEETLQAESSRGYDQMKIYERFRDRVCQRKEELRNFLQQAALDGQKVFGYGASTKGNVLLQFCDITARELPMIADVNPDKFACFTPQSLIPIVAEDEARSLRPDSFLVLPWHFRQFIIAREQQFLSHGGRLVFPLPNLEVTARASDTTVGASASALS